MKRNAATRRAERADFAAYREWLGAIPAICCVSGRLAQDLCHIRHHTGMGIKPPPWEALPLAREYHNRQETLGAAFFSRIGVADPIREAGELWAIYNGRDKLGADAAAWADARLRAIRDNVDQRALAELMEKAA